MKFCDFLKRIFSVLANDVRIGQSRFSRNRSLCVVVRLYAGWILVFVGMVPAPVRALSEELPILPQGELEKLEWRAAAGDAESQFQLGVLYAEGVVVPRSFAEAAQWFHQAAAQGVVAAQYNLGLLYEAGGGVKKNPAEALRWFRQVTDKSTIDPPATFAPADAEDRAAALKWHKAVAHAQVFASPKPIVAVTRYETAEVPDPVPFDDAGGRAARRRTLLLRRMHNDMRYATDSCFGDHRDLWYADVTRPLPPPEPVETTDRTRPSAGDDAGSSPSVPRPGPSEPSLPPEPPPEPPPLPPEPPPGGG